MAFDASRVAPELTAWLRNWFSGNGNGCNAVIGISGGKDSSVTAALCVAALGKERVIGVLMPNGEQTDIEDARHLVRHLDIRSYEINIRGAYESTLAELERAGIEATAQTRINLPPRLRMSTLYAVSQSQNGRVVNTCNLSEDWVGYSTRYGDSVGDVCPLGKFTVQEVKELGRHFGLPSRLVDKVPGDGLTGKSDEDNLGFTYAELDHYIRTGEIEDPVSKERIDRKHRQNLFKLLPMPTFPYEP